MDHIQIKELEVFANHGVLKQENELGQKFVVSVDLTVVQARQPNRMI